MAKEPFEIPEVMRGMAENNVDQMKDAFGKFNDASHNAQTLIEKSSGAMATGVRDIQNLSAKFTEQNMSASFSFASELAHAKSIQEAMAIQQKFAQAQIKSYTAQSQALANAILKASDKAKG